MRKASSTEEESDANKDDEEEDEDASEHRSAVADFVQSLHEIASTTPNRGIGEEVSAVAKEQNDIKDETAKAIDSVKSRGTIVTLLIGANLENIAELKNSIAATENHINQLTGIKARTSPEVAAALDKEISALAAEKDRLTNIVVENENKVSILGWLVRLFQ